MSSREAPPPFEPTNVVNLVSVDDSKIINVSLYSGRAELTRSYKFPVRMGQNQVIISRFPNVVDHWNRVEGRGAATIHDVVLSDIPVTQLLPFHRHQRLWRTLSNKQSIQKSLDRTKKAIFSLESYLLSLKVKRIDVADVVGVMGSYEITGEKLDEKIIELEKKLAEIDESVNTERLLGPPRKANGCCGQRLVSSWN